MALETRRGFKADHVSFAAFLMSDQVADPAQKAAEDIRAAMKAAAEAVVGVSDNEDHYVNHFKVVDNPAVVQGVAPGLVLEGGPRRSADVINDVGYGAVIEYGRRAKGKAKAKEGTHLMRRTAQPWHSNKRGA